MSKVIQFNALVSSRESKTTYADMDDEVSPTIPGGTVSTYPSSIIASFGKGSPDTVEFYLKGGGKLLLASVDETTPFLWSVTSWAYISALYQTAFGAAPSDPFVVTVAVKAVSPDNVEWAEDDYTFASS